MARREEIKPFQQNEKSRKLPVFQVNRDTGAIRMAKVPADKAEAIQTHIGEGGIKRIDAYMSGVFEKKNEAQQSFRGKPYDCNLCDDNKLLLVNMQTPLGYYDFAFSCRCCKPNSRENNVPTGLLSFYEAQNRGIVDAWLIQTNKKHAGSGLPPKSL